MPVRISKNRVALENLPLNLAPEVDVASATTTNIGAATSNNVRITGTTTITAFDSVTSGVIRFIRFASSLTLTHNSTTLKLPSGSNVTTAADDRAIARSFGSGNWEVFHYQKSSGEPIIGSGNAYNLTNIIYPRADGDWRGIYRGGWRPSFFNQQWGGAQWGNGPDGSLVDFATGYVEESLAGYQYFGQASAATYLAVAFKVSESFTPPTIWVKLGKAGNPTDNITMSIYSDNGSGKPNAALMTAIALSGKIVQASNTGPFGWYRFTGTFAALTADTLYHLVLTRSGGIDASNYYSWTGHEAKKYPHGYANYADGTPTWTSQTAASRCFLIENSSSTKFLQSGGQFDGKLQFAEGNPLDQSKGLSQPLKNFFDGREFTYRIVTSSLTKDKTLADFVYGLDHDRIVLRCNATTGYMQLDVYESDGTKHTVTGTTDCSSGTKDIAVYVRAKGDGSDSVKLYVNGTSEGTPVTSATITFDVNFRDLGTAWLGGGFPLAPTWTKDTAMGSLPSADGWTWAQGTGTEAASMSVSGGKLYQNYNGYGATDYGYYWRNVSLSNTNGWAVVAKLKVMKNGGSADNNACVLNIEDGTKALQVYFSGDYYISVGSTSYDRVQLDISKQEHVCVVIGKGSDFFFFVDGRLMVDGTGKMSGTSANNKISFGDATGTSGANADAVWDYVKDYNTAWLPPQFTSGSFSEAAFFSGDRTSILSSLYNGGTLKSVREYCGVEGEYIEKLVDTHKRGGITASPSTTSSSATVMADMEVFVIGDNFNVLQKCTNNHSVAGAAIKAAAYLDGSDMDSGYNDYMTEESVGSANVTLSLGTSKNSYYGLHKFEMRFYTSSGGTTTNIGTRRSFTLESK